MNRQKGRSKIGKEKTKLEEELKKKPENGFSEEQVEAQNWSFSLARGDAGRWNLEINGGFVLLHVWEEKSFFLLR